MPPTCVPCPCNPHPPHIHNSFWYLLMARPPKSVLTLTPVSENTNVGASPTTWTIRLPQSYRLSKEESTCSIRFNPHVELALLPVAQRHQICRVGTSPTNPWPSFQDRYLHMLLRSQPALCCVGDWHCDKDHPSLTWSLLRASQMTTMELLACAPTHSSCRRAQHREGLRSLLPTGDVPSPRSGCFALPDPNCMWTTLIFPRRTDIGQFGSGWSQPGRMLVVTSVFVPPPSPRSGVATTPWCARQRPSFLF